MVLFTGGGTGGHVFPGLAILDRLSKERSVRVAWIGGLTGMERGIVESHSIPGRSGVESAVPYHGIPTGKLRRYISVRNFLDIFKILFGLMGSLYILLRSRPVLVFSKGGFVSVPPVIAAALIGIPVITHESDVDPGLATRINSRFARRVLVPYPESPDYFPSALRDRIVVTGNPLRAEILEGNRSRGLAAAGFDCEDPRPVVMFIGGSSGARQINELVADLRTSILPSWRIIHQTGDTCGESQHDGENHAQAFFHAEMSDLLASADIVVCRAGASTLWEGAALAKPMLLVPLMAGSRGDQLRNSRVFEAAGGAEVFTDPETLATDIRQALDRYGADDTLRVQMGVRAHEVINLDATVRIVSVMRQYIDIDLNEAAV